MRSVKDWYVFWHIAVREVAKPTDQTKKMFHTYGRQRLEWMFFVCPQQPQQETLTYTKENLLCDSQKNFNPNYTCGFPFKLSSYYFI